jgi:diaminohydroxyphosphoribosylaminopyrimidine deaminase/5-amino-6-(5-phosphoribosylamino)uracil reductase
MSKSHTKSNDFFMARALKLARKGQFQVAPNPMVGAVIVKDKKIVAEGYHKFFGSAHAEIEALKTVRPALLKDCTLFVTLEPCCHHGKTPPCTKAIIESGIKKVVIATLDPNKKVCGKGVKELEKAGIKVSLIKPKKIIKEAEELNKAFFTFHKEKRPFVTLKAAVSLDGKIAENRTARTHLTGKDAEKYTHTLRANHQAILVGAGTVLADNPRLTVRVKALKSLGARDPLRVILTGRRPLPKNAMIFDDKNVLVLKGKTITEVMEILYKKEITSVLVEGGQSIFTSFIDAGFVDEIHFLIAPVKLGKKAVDFYKNPTS